MTCYLKHFLQVFALLTPTGGVTLEPHLRCVVYRMPQERHWYQSYGPRREKTCLWGFVNNKGADQPAHSHSLISAFVIRFVESIICKLDTGEISIFWLVPAVEETGLKFALSKPRRQVLSQRGQYNVVQNHLQTSLIALASFSLRECREGVQTNPLNPLWIRHWFSSYEVNPFYLSKKWQYLQRSSTVHVIWVVL